MPYYQQFGWKAGDMRSAETANDFATLADVIDEVIESYKNQAREFVYVCCILPTAPLITLENLKKGLDLMIDRKADSVRPLVRFSFTIQRAVKLKDGKTEMFYPEYRTSRSQDLEPAYHDAGQFYWMSFEKGLRGANKVGFEIPEIIASDIDTIEDWVMAELKYRLLNQK